MRSEMIDEARAVGIDGGAFRMLVALAARDNVIHAWLTRWSERANAPAMCVAQMAIHLSQRCRGLEAQLTAVIESKPIAYIAPISENR